MNASLGTTAATSGTTPLAMTEDQIETVLKTIRDNESAAYALTQKNREIAAQVVKSILGSKSIYLEVEHYSNDDGTNGYDQCYFAIYEGQECLFTLPHLSKIEAGDLVDNYDLCGIEEDDREWLDAAMEQAPDADADELLLGRLASKAGLTLEQANALIEAASTVTWDHPGGWIF